jgi:ribonuclease HII
MPESDFSYPDFSLEEAEQGIVAGLDEAGRGPFAGPVIAAAVILDRSNIPDGINDSKKLSKVQRELLYTDILETGICGIGEASVEEIDEINILQASFLAMRRAVAKLKTVPDVALVDCNKDPSLGLKTLRIVKGDSISLSIAAGSIVAKVTRDRKMCALAERYPYYGWEKNAGYGTAEHRKGLRDHGVTPLHRRSFSPIRKIIEGC